MVRQVFFRNVIHLLLTCANGTAGNYVMMHATPETGPTAVVFPDCSNCCKSEFAVTCFHFIMPPIYKSIKIVYCEINIAI